MDTSTTGTSIVRAASLLAFLSFGLAHAESIEIAGRVVLAGEVPLAEAEVTLLPCADALAELVAETASGTPQAATATRTDAAGRYRLEAPHAGMWKLRVAAPGFAPLETRLDPLIEPIVLEDARLGPDVGLGVQVLGPGGAPIGGASVAVTRERKRGFGRGPVWSAPAQRVRTGDDGRATFARGENVELEISVLAAGFAPVVLSGQRGTAARIELGRGVERTLEVVSAAGRPLAGVNVAVGAVPHLVGSSDERGRLALALEARAPFEIRARHADGRSVATRLGPPPADASTPLRLVLPDRHALVGRLIDAESRRAVQGGVVWDRRNTSYAATTDSAGGFVYSGPLGSRIELAAGAPGYLETRSFEVRLEDDGRPGPTLALNPAAAVAGTVVDPDGKPVALAAVELAASAGGSRMRIEIGGGAPAPRTLSGKRGEFRIGKIDPERSYELRVRAEGFAPASLPVAGLEPYRTRSGLRVQLASGVSLTGTIVDEDDVPLAGATIESAPAEPSGGGGMPMVRTLRGGPEPDKRSTVTDDAGRFELGGLPRATLDLIVRRPGYAKRRLPGVAPREDESRTDLGRIALAPGQTVQGTVRDDAGRPVGDAEIFVREAAGGMVMMVGGPSSAGEEPDTRTDASGFFAVADLDRGLRYDVEVRRRGYVTGRASGIELPRFDPLEIALDPASRVMGVVRDPKGDPIAGASVTLERTRTLEMGGRAMAMMMIEDGSTDQEGRFVFEDQEPGTISLSAVASGYREARRDDLSIPSGEDLAGVEIPLPAGAILEGRVLGADGRAAIGAAVGVVGGAEGLGGMMHDMQRVGVDGNGYYRLEGLGPGPVSIEAVHPDHPRAVRDIELDPGRNALDLAFSGGQTVAGRVSDAEGRPITGAEVELVPAGAGFGGPSTRAGADGAFTMPGVRDGDYEARAVAEGYASARAPVSVAGQPVAGLELRLDRGATLSGRVSGIAPERFAAARVEAAGHGPDAFGSSGVDLEGNYRIEHLPPGSYTVKALLQDSGRQAVGQALVEPASTAQRLDLEFGQGLELSGIVTQADRPIDGVTVFAEGVDVEAEGFSETDHSGKFAIDGLEPGSFRVHVRDFRSGLAYSENVELATSRELHLKLPTASVSGRVRDASDRQALSGVTLTLAAAEPEARPLLAPHTTSTDLDGRFTFSGVANGSWRLRANLAGHATRVVPLELELARSIDDLEIDLEPTEGLTVETRLPGGAAPEAVLLAVLDPSGGRLVGGSYSTGENGRVRLSSVPAGDWELLASAPGAATTAVGVRSPGPPVTVALPAATRLRVEVPALAGTGTVASVSIADASGRAYRALSWSADARATWTLEDGSVELAALPPGSWSVTVAASDGRAWTGQAVTQPGAPARLTLE